MDNLEFNHNGNRFLVQARRLEDGTGAIASVFNEDGSPTGASIQASQEILSDMAATLGENGLLQLREVARDMFISRTR